MTDIKAEAKELIECGIVMPLARMGEVPASHWDDVRSIIQNSLSNNFKAEMVSKSHSTEIIHRTIVQNLHDNPIIVCDVSCQNANVLFELGMRLAFNKPVVLIKDIETKYLFDVGNIEHLEYPRDLRHNLIEKFKLELADKVQKTYDQSLQTNAAKYLDNFGKINVSSLNTKNVGLEDFIKNGFEQLNQRISKINRRNDNEITHKSPGGVYISEHEENLWREFLNHLGRKVTDGIRFNYTQVTNDVSLVELHGPIRIVSEIVDKWELVQKNGY